MAKYLAGILTFALLAAGCAGGESGLVSNDLQEVTNLILVRHAEKADDGTRDPDLSLEGKDRAQRLAGMLAFAEVDAVFSTPYKRTRQTGAVTATQADLEVQEYDPRDPDFLTELLKEQKGKTLLVVGHSNTIPVMVNALIEKETFSPLDEKEYDKLFIVQVVNGKGNVMVLSF